MVTRLNPQAIYWGLVLGCHVRSFRGARGAPALDTQHCPGRKGFQILVLWYGHYWIWSWKTTDNCLWSTDCAGHFYNVFIVQLVWWYRSLLINLPTRLESHHCQGGKNQPAWCDSHHSMDLGRSGKQRTRQYRKGRMLGYGSNSVTTLRHYEKARPAKEAFNSPTCPDRWAEINRKSRRGKTLQMGIIWIKTNIGMVMVCSQNNNNDQKLCLGIKIWWHR